MAAGRFSTIKYNEWICVTAQYEKAVSRIGRQIYQGWLRKKITDHGSITICEDISQAFKDAKELRRELEEEIERDALDGLSYEESKAVDEIRELTGGQKFLREFKMRLARVTTKASVHRNLQAYRDKVSSLSRELGIRAVNQYQSNPILEIKSHFELCRLAERLDEEQNLKWEEITTANKTEGGGLSFHTMLVGFFASFANFGKGTKLGKFTLKLLKYDAEEEKRKLREGLQNTNISKSLEEQLQQEEEVEFDAAKELANMEREYSRDLDERPSSPDPRPASPDPAPASRAEQDRPAPQGPTEAAPTPRRPEILRKKSEPEAGTWGSESLKAPPPPPAPSAPRIGVPPSGATSPPPPKKSQTPEVQRSGWDSGGPSAGSWDPSAPSAPSPGSAQRPASTPRETPTRRPQTSSPSPGTAPRQRPTVGAPPPSPAGSRPSGGSSLGTPPAQPHKAPSPQTPRPPAPTPVTERLSPAPPAPSPSDDELLDGDELLPAFLRNRQEEAVDTEPYVPELPDFLKDDHDSPKLDILPFGKSAEKTPEKPFIPKMPDED